MGHAVGRFSVTRQGVCQRTQHVELLHRSKGANIQTYLAFELDIVEQRDGCTNRTQYEYDDHHCDTENVSQQSASSVHGVFTQDGMMVKVARVPSSNSNKMCDGGV